MKIVIRCDASVAIGTGHVVRCLTLARALAERRHQVSFVMRDLPGNMCDRVAAAGFAVHRLPAPNAPYDPGPGTPVHAVWAAVPAREDAEQTVAALHGETQDWIILDHYAFDAEWEFRVREACVRLMVVDDLADRPHLCELLTDQNLGRHRADYNGLLPDACRRLIGPQFALLRPEFASQRAAVLADRPRRGLNRVIIAMGGIDAPNATVTVLATLPQGLEITVVMGSAAPHLDAVRALAAQKGARVLVDTPDMADLMGWADVAIGGVGGSAWERSALGLPTLMVVLADNQAPAAAALAATGAAVLIGRAEDAGLAAALHAALADLAAPGALGAMSAAAAGLCDGGGAPRVLRALEAAPMHLRPATLVDAKRIWNWRQASDSRLFRSGANPDWPDHAAWFDRALADASRRLYIAETAGRPVGHLRLDCTGDSGTVSLVIDPDYRGQGMAVRMLAAAEAEARRLHLGALRAEVHLNNAASRTAFRQAGYRLEAEADGFLVLTLTL